MSSEPFIPMSVPQLAGNEWTYVKECLDTGWVSSVGSYVERFERELAKKVGSRGAVACSSGTAALHVSLLLAGVREGDEVIVPTLTFIATANAVTYVGAKPVFIDAEPTYFQLDPDKLASFLEQGCTWDGHTLRNRVTSRRVAAIMPVHVLGHPCDMDRILALAQRYQLVVIEDAAESLGSLYKGRPTGTLGQIGCFSFNGNKIITTGNGGMIVTDDEALAAKAKYLTTQAKDDPLEFVHNEVGFNFRLSNMSAALGVAQLELLDGYITKKRAIAKTYDDAFASVDGLTVPNTASWASPNCWLYTVRIDAQRFGCSSRDLLKLFKKRAIESRPLWQPMHLSPAHKEAFTWQCEVAEVLNAECLSIPCSVGLESRDQARVIEVILGASRR